MTIYRQFICLAMIFIAGLASARESEPITFSATDWPWWRGPARTGQAAEDQQPPTTWSETENVVWKTAIPGRSHGSPIVIGDQVIFATAEEDKEIQSVVCLSRETGELLWKTELHHGNFAKNGNSKASMASATPACDGKRIYINFLNKGAIFTTALDREGKQLWQTKVTDYTLHQGFGSSPGIYQSLVLVTADNKGTGLLAGLDRATGDIVWTQERPKLPNYASPIVLHIAGKDQLLLQGCKLVTSLEPLTGKKLWEIEGSTEECVTSTVTESGLIFTSGGYPRNHVAAIKADGSGEVVWENNSRVYVPSMLSKNGHLFAVLDAGVVMCWKADTGEEVWKQRLSGDFSASPVMCGDTVYAINEKAKTFVFKATPEKFESIAENQLGQEAFATPVICGSRIYLRVAQKEEGQRQEYIYCLGKKR